MTTKEESMGMTQVFNCSGVNKEEFLEYTEKNPATYKDWSRVWNQVWISLPGFENIYFNPL